MGTAQTSIYKGVPTVPKRRISGIGIPARYVFTGRILEESSIVTSDAKKQGDSGDNGDNHLE